ncbi:MAG TPA: sugar phosphate nucleotidyltransferase, partial [Burkholderiaceae bacterium]|nr:sugar phosphate nucleotidyltransferase [Burkholderiaceae bacterium]
MSTAPITHALILAAGRGERMRPLTDAVPKPLLRAGGKRLIEWQIESLVRAGVHQIVINVAHLPDQFPAALGDGQRYGAALQYSREGDSADDALESLGGIVRALPWLGNAPFIVTSGDIVTDFPYQSLLRPSDAQRRGDTNAHLVLVANPPFHLRGDMGLVDERIDPDATPRMTYANIGVFSP